MNNKFWLITVLIISFILLGSLKHQHLSTLTPYIRGEKTIKIHSFTAAKKGLPEKEQELLELWESLLTGRSAPLAKWMKERYQELGLKHLFTPSGFHLSAVLSPFLKLFRSIRLELLLLGLVGGGLVFLAGQWALKRMVMIKMGQRIWGQKSGFVIALILDCFFGSFQHSPLSFSYSFLFLGIIYSGLRGIGLVIWFFLAQMLLAHFQGTLISPLLLLFSPILNLAFGLAMPILLLLTIPLWNWQLNLGLGILNCLQWLVNLAASSLPYAPLWEVHFGVVLLAGLFLFRQWKPGLIVFALLTNELNLDLQKQPGPSRYEFLPSGTPMRIVEKGMETLIYFEDGRCKRKLVRGFWWERCFPKRRRSTWKNT